jgi:hypothetical protein
MAKVLTAWLRKFRENPISGVSLLIRESSLLEK